MKVLALVLFCFVTVAVFGDIAQPCDTNKCKRPNCQCSSRDPPIKAKIPQLVTISVDDAAIKQIWEQLYVPILYPRKNPDKCPVSATVFIPHEYTNYSQVNDLYNHGFEIGSHSITKNYSSEYWNNATADLIEAEMGGQRKILAHFANIPIENIISARIPNFQLNGDNTYLGLKKAGFIIDSSWPTRTHNGSVLFPYTLDYQSIQQCYIGTCPTASIPGFWITPITIWSSQSGQDCNKLLACDVKGSAKEISDWMRQNFLTIYNGNRAPFTVLINSAWFDYYENSREALIIFLDYLATLKDVFLVSEKQVLDWMKNPVTADKYTSCVKKPSVATCDKVTCVLQNVQNETRYMVSCVPCPKHYPWLYNPYGDH